MILHGPLLLPIALSLIKIKTSSLIEKWIVIYLFKKEEKFIEPSHVIPAPELPISSFKLAQALNPKTESLKLTRFSNDEDPYVRKAVCRNPSLPKTELERLTKDPDKDVASEAQRIFKNPKINIEETFPTQHGG